MSRLHKLYCRAIFSLSVLLFASCALLTNPEEVYAEKTGDVTEALLPADDDGGGGGDIPINPCLTGTSGSITATPMNIAAGQSSTVEWHAYPKAGCTSVRIYVNSTLVSNHGSLVATPQANATYRLRAYISGYGERTLSSVTISVALPPQVNITSNSQVPQFVQAVKTSNTTVVIANNVQLDLTYKENVEIAPGVTIRGGRGGLQPGPRLFTTTRPSPLFSIPGWSGSVRITGVRIEGPDMGVVDRNGATAIAIDSATNVQIDHNEISGWAGSGVNVKDNAETAGSPSPSSVYVPTHTVQIYDNYIHHNQAIGGEGYGVVVGYGAHPYIARNTFDWNRHAIAADGRPGTGYTAYHNLVLENGGMHRWIPFPGFWTHTHQFDMHGRSHCGIGDIFSDALYNCGPAGHTMLIRHNAFFYHEDDAIKLRGTPEVGMFVGQNVFANHLSFGAATSQEETGLVQEAGNLFGYNGKQVLAVCDFDGDGNQDQLMLTGQNWWLRSGGIAPWTFLNASTRVYDDIAVGYFDYDKRCDVYSYPDDITYPGGKPGRVGGVNGGGVYSTMQ